MAAGYGLGAAGLAGIGLQQKSEAINMMGQLAQQEQERNIHNQQMRDARRAGNQQLGTTLGSFAGMAMGGPVGMAIGAAAGLLAGSLFD
jgi:uncharacterized membrane protein